MSRTVYIGLGVAVFASLYALNLWVVRPRIERDLVRRTRDALEKRNITVKKTHFEGRDGQIEIADSGAADLARASKAAESVFGVRIARITAAETRKGAPSLKVERVGENFTITGTLASEAQRSQFSEAFAQAYAGMSVSEQIAVGEVATPSYLTGFQSMIGLLSSVAPEGTLELTGTTVHLSGEVPSSEAKKDLENRARQTLPKGLSLSLALTAPERTQVAQVTAPVAERDFRREVESTRLGFEFDSTALTPDTVYLVEPLVEMVKDRGKLRLRIIGHADAKGPEAYNLKLSERRSRSIAALLVGNGVPESALQTEGRGESQPTADNSTAEGRAKNRRVEFELVEGS